MLALAIMAAPAASPAPAQEIRQARVVLRCIANFETRKLRGCVVESENPPGQGFGAAALKLTPRMKAPPQAQGVASQREATIRIPVSLQSGEIALR